MKTSTTRQTPLSILAIALAFLLIAATNSYGGHQETWEKSFDVKPGGLLTVESDLGSIEITTNDGNKVEVEIIAEVRTRDTEKAKEILDDFEVDFEQDGNDVSILANYKKRRWSFWKTSRKNPRVEFLISVPEEYNVDLYTAGGSISVGGIRGDAEVETSGGSLGFEKISGSIRGKTSGGSITAALCKGDVDIKTSGGSINIDNVEGEVFARTSGGSVKVEEIQGMIDASTSGGSVTAHITGQPTDDCRLVTSGGSVKVYLNEDVNVYVDAKTSAGRVSTDFPVTVRGKMKKSSLRGKINEGGPELYLRTSGGNIYLKEI